jgi:large subunit ribosomal protein L18
MKVTTTAEARKRRHYRVRRKVRGTAARPRMCVCITNKHFYVQFVDDDAGLTLAQVSTIEKGLAGKRHDRNTAAELGRLAAERAVARGIAAVVFDRGGFAYGARMKALADAAREAGLQF